ncbi:hypothetical protein C8Q73DRAFT_474847 [Cubamyces lactineus]|nr:hypothetical protein C8Q73DRAFT_474847 [Cubamyces lactineus]
MAPYAPIARLQPSGLPSDKPSDVLLHTQSPTDRPLARSEDDYGARYPGRRASLASPQPFPYKSLPSLRMPGLALSPLRRRRSTDQHRAGPVGRRHTRPPTASLTTDTATHIPAHALECREDSSYDSELEDCPGSLAAYQQGPRTPGVHVAGLVNLGHRCRQYCDQILRTYCNLRVEIRQ